jgi:spore maturation protein CgeB
MPRTCVEQNLPVTVYGRGWEDRLPKEVVAGSSVRNELLSDYYRAAKIVLNDHWPDMARRGFISNRIFDAGLSGTLVISDDFEGKEIFFGSVPTCRDRAELEEKTRFFLASEEARRTLAGRLRHIVALSHTFDHRAQTLLRIARRTAAFRLGLPAGLATTTIDRPVEAPPGFDASAKPQA